MFQMFQLFTGIKESTLVMVLKAWEGGREVDKSIYGFRLEEGMGILSARLESLQNMICTLCMGLKDDNIEKQAIDVIECIGLCISDIKNFADNILETST